MKSLYFLIATFLFVTSSIAQEAVFQTFKDTRVINSHSVETIKAGRMDFRIAHRFGDIAGTAGGWSTFYGLENASDVMIGFEFGLSDKLMFGLNRTKGTGPLKQNVNTFFKYKLITQEIEGNQPFSLAFMAMSSASTMPKSRIEGVLNFFEKTAHRFSYHMEIILAKKFSNRFSLQASGAWTYRNIVPANDQNDLVSLGGAMRLQLTKAMGILIDSRFPLSGLRTTENGYYPTSGVALEWETGGGHVFQLNFTNSRGLAETDFIPYTTSNWLDGEYRMGFTVSRLFTL
jgi:hypothetical protein